MSSKFRLAPARCLCAAALFLACSVAARAQPQVAAERVVARPGHAPPAPLTQLAGRRVLVIDDDVDAREVATAALTGAGPIVEAAATAGDALARTRESRYAAIVCDIAMPGLDGYEFLRRFREHESRMGWFTPAIALSAFADHEAETRALNAGFQRFVAKPFDFTALVVAVADVSSGGVT